MAGDKATAIYVGNKNDKFKEHMFWQRATVSAIKRQILEKHAANFLADGKCVGNKSGDFKENMRQTGLVPLGPVPRF